MTTCNDAIIRIWTWNHFHYFVLEIEKRVSYLVMLFGTRTSVKQDLLFYIDISDQICYIKACLFCYFINAV